MNKVVKNFVTEVSLVMSELESGSVTFLVVILGRSFYMGSVSNQSAVHLDKWITLPNNTNFPGDNPPISRVFDTKDEAVDAFLRHVVDSYGLTALGDEPGKVV